MPLKLKFAAAVAMLAVGLLSPTGASAFVDGDRPIAPRGWAGPQTVRHWVYYPRYRNFYYTNGQTDPFAYRYEPHGYYPYYNSGYWKPRSQVPLHRAHFAAPKYYGGWGRNKKHWSQAKWNAEHHVRERSYNW